MGFMMIDWTREHIEKSLVAMTSVVIGVAVNLSPYPYFSDDLFNCMVSYFVFRTLL
jgi:hypothetical protein